MRFRPAFCFVTICLAGAQTRAANTVFVPDQFPTLQAAVNATSPGDTVIIRPGTYNGTTTFANKNITIQSTDPNDPAVVDATILDGQGAGTVLYITGPDTSTVRGLTFRNGDGLFGGGLTLNGANVLVENNLFRSNHTTGRGGGMHIFDAAPTLRGNRFTENVSATFGGALLIQAPSGPVEIVDCTFFNNTAKDGGGIAALGGTVTIRNARILDNHATHASAANGGGIYNSGTVNLLNSLVASNDATAGSGGDGGGIANFGNLNMLNVTIVDNVVSNAGGGGGIFQGGGTILVSNSVCWGGQPSEIAAAPGTNAPSFTYSDTPGRTPVPGAGNIAEDPMFADPDGADDVPGTLDDDYRPGPGSPLIDAGNNEDVPPKVMTDLDGNVRFFDDPDVIDVGFGDAPIVDMGCFEGQGAGPCVADFDGDGDRDLDDLQLLLFNFGRFVVPFTGGDADGDSDVDLDDLQLLLFYFGTPC
ncbi:MAG: right-handed parallel beta-helix repeat-containing protein [Phycisphaerales bacterium]|nr:right-handed parallel beta-helix repeat-containing protein [Phycisphaerales bacterium]